MAEVQIPSDKVPPLVQDAGLVAGLLAKRGDQLVFLLDFFADPIAGLKAIPSRRSEILKLLRTLLGKPAPKTPADRSWYSIDWEKEATGVYVVLPKDDSGAKSTIGIGLLSNGPKAELAVQASLYIPLFNLPIAPPLLITGSNDFPIELALTMPLGRTVTAGSLVFDAVRIGAKIVFSGAPAFVLAFVNKGQTQTELRTLDAIKAATIAINALLNTETATGWLNQKIGSSPFTIGDVFVAMDVLKRSGTAYELGTLDTLASKTPREIAELLFAKALQKLAAEKKPLVKFGDGGIWAFAQRSGVDTDYGLRIQIEDVDVSPAGGPRALLQVGKLMSGDAKDSSWISRSDPGASFPEPGISYTFVRINPANVPSFRPKVDFVSIGLDFAGAADAPLVDVSGVTLRRVEPRFLLSLDLADLSKVPWGAGMRCDQVGIPLGNGLSRSSSNPIAQNLLSSGDSDRGDAEPVNPAFSAAISRVTDPARPTRVDVRLEQDGGAAETIWIPVQRAFGPLQCRRMGVEWPEDNPNLLLTFLFDGNVSLAALAVELEGLSVGIPLRTPGQVEKYKLDLQGLGVSYASGPLTITAALLKNSRSTPLQYDGAALVRAERWSIAAVGSYAVTDGQPSLFVFARLGAAIGGPPVFFMTGLCAGFGYNRSLRLPKLEEVPSFPLLAGIEDPAKIGGANPTPGQALVKLKDWIAPAQGTNWFAAGVQFTSFQLVKSNAILVVIPGPGFQAAILGVSRVKLPQEGSPFAYAELAFSAVLNPSAGVLAVSAQLSPNSFVLTKECCLTGGFAFWLWFDGEHAGDFVITLGGYHPAFIKPDHYPDVPRLGFSWEVNSNLTIRGGAYFALTPSCAMAGGSLDVDFHSGNLRAWFRAHADFLFQWKPFYFTGSVGVSIGASYKLNLLFTTTTVSVELGADLELWGPPTGGKVHVSWYIISFTVGFGADRRQTPGFLQWNDFQWLLPANDRVLKGEANTDPVPLTNLIKATIAEGRIPAAGDRWVVRGDSVVLSIETAFPLTLAELAGGAMPAEIKPEAADYFVAVRPMGISGVTSKLTVRVSGHDLARNWNFSPVTRAVPAALWGKPLPEGATPNGPSAETLPDRLVGIDGFAPQTSKPTGPDAVPLVNLSNVPINPSGSRFLPLWAKESAVGRQPRPSPASLQVIASSIASTAVPLRAQLFAALATLGYDAGANDRMTNLAANVNDGYPDAPMLGAPWQGAA